MNYPIWINISFYFSSQFQISSKNSVFFPKNSSVAVVKMCVLLVVQRVPYWIKFIERKRQTFLSGGFTMNLRLSQLTIFSKLDGNTMRA